MNNHRRCCRTRRSMSKALIAVGFSIVRVQISFRNDSIPLTGGESGDSAKAFLEEDDARKNVAELGLGCNLAAIVTPNILEDEKAGPHIALGRSDHLGGAVGSGGVSEAALASAFFLHARGFDLYRISPFALRWDQS